MIYVVKTFLRYQWERRLLPCGEAVLPVQGLGRLCLRVDEGGVDVYLSRPEREADRREVRATLSPPDAWQNRSGREAQAPGLTGTGGADEEWLTGEEAAEVLFSPLSVRRNALACRNPALAVWLPLPLYLEANDCF